MTTCMHIAGNAHKEVRDMYTKLWVHTMEVGMVQEMETWHYTQKAEGR
jgi:hypothetical protein